MRRLSSFGEIIRQIGRRGGIVAALAGLGGKRTDDFSARKVKKPLKGTRRISM
jgi:hypothetical protein